MGKESKTARTPDDHVLTGTFVSVMLLGGFLVITWLGVFILFLIRG